MIKIYYIFRSNDFKPIKNYIDKFNISYKIISENKYNTVMCFTEKYEDINRMRCTYFEEYLNIYQVNYKKLYKKLYV